MAPLGYALAGSSASQQSLAQGVDFGNYHAAQHGGVAPLPQAYDMLETDLRGSAMLTGIDRAIQQSAQLRDLTSADANPVVTTDQSGGRKRRRRSQKKRRSQKNKKNQRKSQRKQQRKQQRGGGDALSGAGVNDPTMLLDAAEYRQAGLNPDYYKGTSTEQFVANQRDMV
jgi:hypothetical protein